LFNGKKKIFGKYKEEKEECEKRERERINKRLEINKNLKINLFRVILEKERGYY